MTDVDNQFAVMHGFDCGARQDRLPDPFDLDQKLVFVNANDGTKRRTIFTLEQLVTNLYGYALGHG